MRVVIQAGTEAIIWRRIDGILQHSSVNRQRHEIFIRRAQLNFQHMLLVQFSALGWNLLGDIRLGVCQGRCLLKISQRRASGSFHAWNTVLRRLS